MDRRTFNKVCSSLLTGAASLSRNASGKDTDAFPVSQLLDQHDRPLKIASLNAGDCFIFNYPYVTTPCFLLRLSTVKQTMHSTVQLSDRAGRVYHWQGGVGRDRSVVAFSAICSHKMSHPAKPVSHLNYRAEEIQFSTEGSEKKQSQLIVCCSEHSVYDATDGARVLSGPATQPLAAIALDVDSEGQISAIGSYGGNMYAEFLQKFGFRLAMEAGVTDAATLCDATTTAIAAEIYSQQQIFC